MSGVVVDTSSSMNQTSERGGMSLLDTAKLATGYFYDSGIAGIDKSSFSKLLDLKNSSLNVSLALNTRNISANTNNDSFEDIVKLINRIFTSKNYQDDLWEKTKKIAKESQKASNLNPDSIFYKTANEIFTSKNEMFTDVNFDDIERIYFRTTDQGPFICDVWFGFETHNQIIELPQGCKGEADLLDNISESFKGLELKGMNTSYLHKKAAKNLLYWV